MKSKKILLAIILGLGVVSCDKYLDINIDPNSPAPENITTDMMMPAIEMNIASSYGNYLRITGGFHAQHYAHLFGTSNYIGYSQFYMSATQSSSDYTQFTQRALSNLKTVMEKAETEKDWGTYLAATTLRAFTYQILVDCYGEVPYTEALNPSILAPKYDDGKTIYLGIISELNNALSKASESDLVCTNFLFPSETAGEWIKFANALKLKLLMRMADVEDIKEDVKSLIEEDNFPTNDIAYKDCWANEPGKMNPFYAEEFSTAWGSTQINIAANLAVVGTMLQKDEENNVVYQDPRLEKIFAENINGEYVGGISGTNYPASTSKLQVDFWCRPIASYDMPVYLISVAEIEFFKAEYEARYGTASAAESHYNAAIQASFETVGAEGAEYYIARYPYNNQQYKRIIGEAKWIALAGINNFEAWCEMRRLDYPAFGTKSGADFYKEGDEDSYNVSEYVPFTLYTPILVYGEVGSNKLLERFPYAESSSSRNEYTPKFPGYTSPVFWGK